MDIGVYDDYCEEEDISLKVQKYTHLEAMEAINVMRSYMTKNDWPIRIFNSMDVLHCTAQQKRSKSKKK